HTRSTRDWSSDVCSSDLEYRISQGHDSAAALIVDGVCVAAAAEERFSRKKHTGDFPSGAIQYCLSEAGLEIGDVDEIAHGFDYRSEERSVGKECRARGMC